MCWNKRTFVYSCSMLHIVMIGLSRFTNFSTLSRKRQEFRKQSYWKRTFVLIFSPTFVRIISHSKKCARCDKKYLLVLMENAFFFCPILMKFEFSWQIFEKCSNIKFHENPSIWSRVFPCGLTNSHVEAGRNYENAPKNRYKREQCALTLHDTSYSWQMGPRGSL